MGAPQAAAQAAYRTWAAGHVLPLFHQPAWLDTVCPGAWGAAVAPGGGWPFVLTRRWGLATLANPPLSHRLGPWVAPGTDRQAVLQALLEALPRYDRLLVGGRDDQPVVPLPYILQHSGLSQQLSANNQIGSEELLYGYSKSWRKKVRKGLAHRIETGTLPPAAEALYDTVLLEGGTQPLPAGLVRRLVAAFATGALPGQVWVLYDDADQPIASALVAYDAQRTYYLANGRNPQAEAAGAVHALTHLAIIESLAAGRAFDFMGSRLPGVANFNQGFGAVAVPYPILAHNRHWLYRLYAHRTRT
ncbi:MAG: GNAT family N-acetyltransferase [Bacteroidia bacterium]|nr:GNAT family N-acetyltransferase [Bacteroidia bacterium]